ncbi:hypothetical protein BJ912DRAFT_121224 [Pholiota molesta]|nr:hypothetical protein BJ912DRAFT_121224 [Pholiota molesta]
MAPCSGFVLCLAQYAMIPGDISANHDHSIKTDAKDRSRSGYDVHIQNYTSFEYCRSQPTHSLRYSDNLLSDSLSFRRVDTPLLGVRVGVIGQIVGSHARGVHRVRIWVFLRFPASCSTFPARSGRACLQILPASCTGSDVPFRTWLNPEIFVSLDVHSNLKACSLRWCVVSGWFSCLEGPGQMWILEEQPLLLTVFVLDPVMDRVFVSAALGSVKDRSAL